MMDLLHILGYVSAILIGIVIGLIGGGGSILAIPVLVYLFGIEPLAAISYSFLLVGVTASVGAFSKIKLGEVDFKTALLLGIPDIIGVVTMRLYIFPPIPGDLFLLGTYMVTKSELVMILFSMIMLFSGYTMIRKQNDRISQYKKKASMIKIILLGLCTGLLTGMVGVGGGFLIIPVLVLLALMPIQKAIGTSLVIIAVKSFIGFFTDRLHLPLDYSFIASLSALSLFGLALGVFWSKKVSHQKIQFALAVVLILLGLYILFTEMISI